MCQPRHRRVGGGVDGDQPGVLGLVHRGRVRHRGADIQFQRVGDRENVEHGEDRAGLAADGRVDQVGQGRGHAQIRVPDPHSGLLHETAGGEFVGDQLA